MSASRAARCRGAGRAEPDRTLQIRHRLEDVRAACRPPTPTYPRVHRDDRLHFQIYTNDQANLAGTSTKPLLKSPIATAPQCGCGTFGR